MRSPMHGLMAMPRVLARVWIPLDRALFCLNCEAVFTFGEYECPGCGSAQWVPLAKWLQERKTEAAMNPKDCVEPGCPQEAVVGLNGAWVCLDHFHVRVEAMKQALRSAVQAAVPA